VRRIAALRPEHLLPVVCAGAAILLAASEFMDVFHFNPPSGVAGQTFAVDTAADRHHYALLVLAIFATIALVIAIASGSKPAAAAVAIAGAAALLLFLLVDLPDAGNVGTFNDPRESFFNAQADPATGFWVELAGAAMLAISGGALATLSSEQLRRLGDPFRLVPRGPRPRGQEVEEAAKTEPGADAGREATRTYSRRT
jgi:hypothetical protein